MGALFGCTAWRQCRPDRRAYIAQADQSGCRLTVVDASADFRYADAAAYAKPSTVSRTARRICSTGSSARCRNTSPRPINRMSAIPAVLPRRCCWASVPLMKLGLITDGDDLSCRRYHRQHRFGPIADGGHASPVERHSNLYAYKPLAHRHAPEVTGICAAPCPARQPTLQLRSAFGPVRAGHSHDDAGHTARTDCSADDIREALQTFYADSEFVSVVDGTPKLKDIAGSNYAHIGVAAVDQETVVVLVVIDNLVKGAAGGAVQWMNRQARAGRNSRPDRPGAGMDLIPLVDMNAKDLHAQARKRSTCCRFMASCRSNRTARAASTCSTRAAENTRPVRRACCGCITGLRTTRTCSRRCNEQAGKMFFQSNAVALDVRAGAADAGWNLRRAAWTGCFSSTAAPKPMKMRCAWPVS